VAGEFVCAGLRDTPASSIAADRRIGMTGFMGSMLSGKVLRSMSKLPKALLSLPVSHGVLVVPMEIQAAMVSTEQELCLP
jgi:hypothetical protein